jgi:hypothetical protein
MYLAAFGLDTTSIKLCITVLLGTAPMASTVAANLLNGRARAGHKYRFALLGFKIINGNFFIGISAQMKIHTLG